jgi:alpha-1,2-mannosyltransferase
MKELKKRNSKKAKDIVLLMFGSTRNSDDESYVKKLEKAISSANVEDTVKIYVNQSYNVLRFFLSTAHIGLHTMWNEHFGISIVEMIASGIVTIAHNSGGPKDDIIKNHENGYLADTAEGYCSYIEDISQNYEKKDNLKVKGREKAKEFSDEIFVTKMLTELKHVIKQ